MEKKENIVYSHGSSEFKQIAIVFDDGPANKTEEILRILKKAKAKATFFILGKKIKGNEQLLRKIKKEGHEIGNHTYSHLALIFKTRKRILEEIIKTDEKLGKLGIKTNLLRPPYLWWGYNLVKVCKELKKKIILCSWRSWDSIKMKSSESIIKRIIRKADNGTIIGIHEYLENIGTNDRVVDILKGIIPELKKRGYKLVTVSKLLELK